MNLPFQKPAAASLPPLEIPRLEDVSEAYAALQQKTASIGRELSDLERKRQALIMVLRESRDADPKSGRRQSTEVDQRIAEILGDAVAPATHELSVSDEIDALDKRRNDLEAAMRVANERLDAERIKASVIICQQVEPHYRALMTEIAGKMCEVVHLAVQYEQFALGLNNMNIAWARLDPMAHTVGGAAQRASVFRAWLEGAISRGFASKAQLPETRR